MERPDQGVRVVLYLDCGFDDHPARIPLLRLPHRHSSVVRATCQLRDSAGLLPHPLLSADLELLEDDLHRRRGGSIRAGRSMGTHLPSHLPRAILFAVSVLCM